jgi:protein ImuB
VTRVACIAVPAFPLAARLRQEPELREEPLVVLEKDGEVSYVVAVSLAARRAGLVPGLTLPQARSFLPSLSTRLRDPECERAAQETLLEVAARFSPRVEDAGDGIVYVETWNAERHFPGAEPERDGGRALIAAARRAGLDAQVGIAATKLVARVAAASHPSPTLVATGEEASFLAPLPLRRLEPEPDLASLLSRWGLTTIGDFARLPAPEVASRLGAAGQKLHAAARGHDPQPLVPRPPPPELHEGMDFEWPVTNVEPLLFVARTALERLAGRLETRGQGCARLGLSLKLDPDGYCERALQLPAPTRDVKTLLTLIRLELAARPPGAPVVGFAFTIWPARTRQVQLSLTGPAQLSSDRLATTLGQLAALLGPERLGSPHAPPGHLPERYALRELAPPPSPRVAIAPRPEPSSELAERRRPLVVRALRPPVPVEVLTAVHDPTAVEVPSSVGTPTREAGGPAGSPGPRIAGAARQASGPWIVEDAWWTKSAGEREYWDVELSDGATYRLYRDRRSGDWFADGIYD